MLLAGQLDPAKDLASHVVCPSFSLSRLSSSASHGTCLGREGAAELSTAFTRKVVGIPIRSEPEPRLVFDFDLLSRTPTNKRSLRLGPWQRTTMTQAEGEKEYPLKLSKVTELGFHPENVLVLRACSRGIPAVLSTMRMLECIDNLATRVGSLIEAAAAIPQALKKF
eukprot:1477685-Rhodomonas_salina.3